jgi:hypothetical protein
VLVRLQLDSEAHLLKPCLALGRIVRAEDPNQLQVELLVEDRLVVLSDAILGDLVEIAVLEMYEIVRRTTGTSGTEHGDVLAKRQQHLLCGDTAATQHEQPRLTHTGVSEHSEQLNVLGQVTVPARRSAGTLLENPEEVQQRVGDGALVHLLGKLEAGVLPAIAECLVGAGSVTPGSWPQLRVVRGVPSSDGVGQTRRLHRGHRTGEGSVLAQDPGPATADGDPVEPEGLRRIAAEQASDGVEQSTALRLRTNTRRAGNVEVAGHALHGAKDDRSRNLVVHVADHQGHIATTGAGDGPVVPGLARSKKLVVTDRH